MSAIFTPQGQSYRATEHAGGPWSPTLLQGSATTALMAREVETVARQTGFAIRRLTFDLWRPAELHTFDLAVDMLRDGRRAKTLQVRLCDGDVEVARCSALLTARGSDSPPVPGGNSAQPDPGPDSGTPPPAFAQAWSRYFQHVSVRLIEGALEKPGPAAAWMRLDVPLVEGTANSPLVQAVQAADFASGVSQIVDMRQWSFINPDISLAFYRDPQGDWILIRARTLVGDAGAGLIRATLSDRHGPFAEVLQSTSFERRQRPSS